MTDDQYPDDRDRILDQLRARSAWQTPTTAPPPPPQGGRTGSNQVVVVAVGVFGVLLVLFLLFSAGGPPSGGGSMPAGGTVVTTALTEKAAAETVGRFVLAGVNGDASTVAQLIAPSQTPLSYDVQDALESVSDDYASLGASSPTTGWYGDVYQIEVYVDSSPISLNCSPVFADAEYADVDVWFESDGDVSETYTCGLIAHAGSWRVETVDGEPISDALD